MDYNQVKILLEKYWEGESSLEEERQLKDFFSYSEVPEELREHQEYFQFLKSEKEVQIRSDFDLDVVAEIKKKNQPSVRRTMVLNFLKIAAVALLFWSTFSYFQKDTSMEGKILAWEAKYEPENPQEAYRQTKAALYLLSSTLKKGTTKAVKSVNRVQESTKIFN